MFAVGARESLVDRNGWLYEEDMLSNSRGSREPRGSK